MKKNTIIVLVILALLVIWGVYAIVKYESTPGQYDTFAQCLKKKEVKFYGAFWCPHCQAQKALFGKSVKYLPYIECSNPDGQSQDVTCNDAKIESYPTWEFTNNGSTTRRTGEQSLQTLADQTGCSLTATTTQ